MVALHLLSCVVAIVALAYLLAGRVPDWCFLFLPCIFFVPDLFYMNVDWIEVREWISSLGTGITGVAAAFGVLIWKRQLIGKDKYDAAKKILLHVYHLARVVRAVRAPWRSGTQCLDKLGVATSELEIAFLEGQVHWGEEYEDSCRDLMRLSNTLYNAVQIMHEVRDPSSGMNDDTRQILNDENFAIEFKIKDDAFGKEFEAAVRKIVQSMLKHIS